jgi:SsrA-binding protein
MDKSEKNKSHNRTIVLNKKARFDYFIEERFEAGIALEGWEVKSLRSGKVQIRDSYILIKDNEAYLFGSLITPLPTVSTHISPDPQRNRKLLLHRKELNKLIGAVERKGYALVPTAMYWKNGRVKVEIGLALGKKTHDKRDTEKKRDWQRQRQRLLTQVKSGK